jgi:hypothetical protein
MARQEQGKYSPGMRPLTNSRSVRLNGFRFAFPLRIFSSGRRYDGLCVFFQRRKEWKMKCQKYASDHALQLIFGSVAFFVSWGVVCIVRIAECF